MNKLPYKLLIFDWDGTLMDSAAHIVSSVQKALADLELPEVPEQKIRSVIGMTRESALKAALPDLPVEKQRALLQAYEKHFFTGDELPIRPFNGAPEVLKDLEQQGYLLAVATSKARRGFELDLEQHHLQQLFVASHCGDEGFSKPHPHVLLDVLQRTGIEPREALMIGDSEYDLVMARQAGVDALAVSYGVQSKDMLLECKPLDCIDNIKELPAWLANRG